MATFPYIPSVKSISDAFTLFRKSLPPVVDSDTLKKLGIAPNNESALISILSFLGLIDSDSKPTESHKDIFFCTIDEFGNRLADHIKSSYSELYALYGEDAWNLSQEKLIGYFRQADKTSEITGQRQAKTFIALAELTGKRASEAPQTKSASTSTKANKAPTKAKVKAADAKTVDQQTTIKKPGGPANSPQMTLSVRIEVNLPAVADQNVYDSIFKSIKENLMS